MIDTITSALCAALKSADIRALRGFPPGKAQREGGPVVAIGILSAEISGSGAGEYLGIIANSPAESGRELYGFKLEVVFSLDIWSPRDGAGCGAEGCEAMFDAISGISELLPSGLKMRSVSRKATAFDRGMEMFRCEAQLACTAYVYGEKNCDDGEFTDFILKGELVRSR